MARSPQKLIADTLSSISTIEVQLEEFVVTRDELNRQLRNARRRLDRKVNGTAYPEKVAKQAIQSAKEQAPTILMQAIDAAILRSIEFSENVYKTMLYKVAQDESIYKFITRGTGWNINLSVQIVFESVAGTLSDYARGIIAYREYLKTKINDSSDGEKATNWWLEHVYGNSSLLTKTVVGRVQRSGRPDGAPFWQILNSGGTELSSDRPDGSYNPIYQPPTNFIGNAEGSIKTEFNLIFLPEQIKWLQEAEELRKFINSTEEERDSVSREIYKLRVEAAFNKRVFDDFGKLKKFVDSGKVADAIERYRAGEEFERVYVSKKGAKKRVYLTVKRLEGYID